MTAGKVSLQFKDVKFVLSEGFMELEEMSKVLCCFSLFPLIHIIEYSPFASLMFAMPYMQSSNILPQAEYFRPVLEVFRT